jgi:nitrogen fixation/metabolism regulation signal transduction histidine kinase
MREMAASGRIQRRLAAAIVLTALIPLLVATILARSMVRQTADRFFLPEIGHGLDESLNLFQELARSQKESMRYQGAVIAGEPELLEALVADDPARVHRALNQVFSRHDRLVSLEVEGDEGPIARVDRGRPVDDEKEFALSVESAIPGSDGALLTAEFATARARFDRLGAMSELVGAYRQLEQRRFQDERTYILAFAVLLGITILLAILVGTRLARGVSRRVEHLASATARVGAGDLSVRVDESGADELSDLSRGFNRMLVEVETSRARIEYLQRKAAWQDMARRLAHEIKNPLTPIQLAMEEVHNRYPDRDDAYRQVLDEALEVVQAEVGTLRRLVTVFSDFARLPRAVLEPANLTEVFRELSQLSALEMSDEPVDDPTSLDVAVVVPQRPVQAQCDREMIRRAILNLLRNAVQAVRSAGAGRVRASIESAGDFWDIVVDDSGPGIAPDLESRIFDPYVTTKTDGTGLGLAIVKKISVEHGGSVRVEGSPLGGARFVLSVPAIGTASAADALASALRSDGLLDPSTPEHPP